MGKTQLTVKEAEIMFIYVSKKMVDSKDALTQADKAIGDGDHGIGMARGFEAVGQKLETQSFTSVGELFKSIGMTLMTSIGGAAGAVFGTFKSAPV
ncbi:MAG: DAK2 domain-containing protein [bacterium]|nr:DAK2 domain-containing protein [bacterium]